MVHWLGDLLIDLRIAVRLLAKNRSFTAVAAGSLALGIGANTALFAVVNSLILRSIPYSQPEQLVEINVSGRALPLDDLNRAASFDGVATFIARGFSVKDGGEIRNLFGFRVSPNLFSVLGVKSFVGRTFVQADTKSGHVAVISYEHWQRLSGNASVLGRTLTIGDEPYTIIGVLPPDFWLSVRDGQIFVPYPNLEGRTVGRLKSNASVAQAQAELTAIANGLQSRSTIRLEPLTNAFRPGAATTLLLLQAAVGLVLLITCANAGNLMLVRTIARSKEFAIRNALGAGGWRIIRQALTESAVLAVIGGAAGLLVAKWSVGYLSSVLPGNVSRYLRGTDGVNIDLSVVLFTCAISIAALAVFGLLPAVQLLRFDIISQLRDSAKSIGSTRQRLGELMVVVEIALALMLLIGVGVTLKSLAGLEKQYLGFNADRVLRVPVDLVATRHPRPEQRLAVITDITDRVQRIPGVESVGITAPQFFPFGGPRVRGSVFEIDGKPGAEARAEVYSANPGYFRTIRIPLLRGRYFNDTDNASSEPVAIISDIVAKRYWGASDPLGQRVRLTPHGPGASIVGVVGDVRNPLASDVQPIIYRPVAQGDGMFGLFMIRTTAAPPMTIASAVKQQLMAADSGGVSFRPADLGLAVAEYLSPQRFFTSVLGSFAFAGLLLAAMGVYAIMRYWVGARIPEIGIRIALGAQPSAIWLHVLRQAVRAAMAGIALGAAGSFALQRFLAGEIYGVSPTDPAVIIAVCLLMATIAMLAAFVPARWASKIDPVVALRQ